MPVLPNRLHMPPEQGPRSSLKANDQLRANVRELLDLRRWTQTELADRLGQSQPWLSKRLTGTTPFQIEDVDAIAAAFDLSPSDLLCVGFGQWDRRSMPDRRSGLERRYRRRDTQDR